MPGQHSDVELRSILAASRTVAVLGAHPDPGRPAHYVPAYLQGKGYKVVPVNALYAGQEVLGATVCGALKEIGEPIDVVDVFRRSEALPGHLDEILSMSPLPKVVWLQSGIRNDDFAQRLTGAGIAVVQDRCMLAEHRRLIG